MLPAVDAYARSSEDPEQELISRELARKRLLDFATYTYHEYIIDPLQTALSGYLERVLSNDIHRLMVFAPPQHGKSELVSVRFPAFWFAHRPNDPIVLCSYGSELAYDKVNQTREVIDGLQYKALFPSIRISEKTRGGTNWRIKDHRGIMYSAGVGGPITGHGAMLGIIDDPFKNYQEAESPVMRERVWKWYTTTFRTRIWEKGAILLVMTRWHEDDLAGRLLQDRKNGSWDVLRLPAIAETQAERDQNNTYLNLADMKGQPDPAGRAPGEPLCPQRFSLPALEALRVDVGPIAWPGQYMAIPRLPEGNIFKRSWLKLIELDFLPSELTLVRYWDKAATEGGGKRSAGVLVGRDKLKRYYIIDVVKGQWSTFKRETMIRQTAERDHSIYGLNVTTYIEKEGGAGGVDSATATVANLAGFNVHLDSPLGSKLARFGPFMGQAEAGNIMMVRATWNIDYLEELTAIPVGTFWDQTDATSGAFNALARTGWSRGAKR